MEVPVEYKYTNTDIFKNHVFLESWANYLPNRKVFDRMWTFINIAVLKKSQQERKWFPLKYILWFF